MAGFGHAPRPLKKKSFLAKVDHITESTAKLSLRFDSPRRESPLSEIVLLRF